MNRDEYVSAIKLAFITLGNRVAYGYLVAQFPFLAWVGFRQVIQAIVTGILESIADDADMRAFFLYIDVRTSQQGREFEAAAIANRRAQESGTDEEKIRAEEELWVKFIPFARLSG